MKNIAIVTWKMVLGGTEKSLISLLEAIPSDKYNITLMVMDKGGELLKKVPEHINVEFLHIPENSSSYQIKQYLKDGKLIQSFKVGWHSFLSSRSKDKLNGNKIIRKCYHKTSNNMIWPLRILSPHRFLFFTL